MTPEITRRHFVTTIPVFSLGAVVLNGLPMHAAATDELPIAMPTLWPGFPRQDTQLVREIVGAAHFNETRVRELVELKPALVNAWWDWGFGDWESPLGAASHVGHRAIAEFLIERGARMDIFASAMLGYKDTVKAFVTAMPGIQRTLGPHGIPLLAHALVGGEKAKDTLDYLETLGDAGTTPPTQPLAQGQRQLYVGKYRYGPAESEVFDIRFDDDRLFITRGKEIRQRMHFVGNDEFFPAGVPSLRIRFSVEDDHAVSLTMVEGELILTASRLAT